MDLLQVLVGVTVQCQSMCCHPANKKQKYKKYKKNNGTGCTDAVLPLLDGEVISHHHSYSWT